MQDFSNESIKLFFLVLNCMHASGFIDYFVGVRKISLKKKKAFNTKSQGENIKNA